MRITWGNGIHEESKIKKKIKKKSCPDWDLILSFLKKKKNLFFVCFVFTIYMGLKG